MTTFDHFIRMADQLGQVPSGSSKADQAIHAALGRKGPAPPYSRDVATARSLLPDGFEWRDDLYSAGTVYASCRRSGLLDGYPYGHNGQWGKTPALAACGAVMRARAGMMES